MEHKLIVRIMELEYYGATDIGRVRQNNEDSFITLRLTNNLILLGVVDGMGGYEGGEIATEIFIKTVTTYLYDFQDDSPLNLLKRAFIEGNNQIIRYKEFMPKYKNMGAVGTLGLINLANESLSIAHVGDSRLYRYSNGMLKKLTSDDSRVGHLEQEGILSEAQALTHPQRSVIYKSIGHEYVMYGDEDFLQSGVFPISANEKYIFNSDGLTDMLTSAQIVDCLKENLCPEDECNLLIKMANDMGGKDNITVVIANVYKTEHIQEDTENRTDYTSLHESSVDSRIIEGKGGSSGDDVSKVTKRTNKFKLFITYFLIVFVSFLLGFLTGHYGWINLDLKIINTNSKSQIKFIDSLPSRIYCPSNLPILDQTSIFYNEYNKVV